MFRMLRLKPPNGWNAVGWELAIVTVGVLVALGAQQLANDWNAKRNARAAIAAIRTEVGDDYASSVEWRVVQPCILAQIDRLQLRLTNSGNRLEPAPVYSEPGYKSYVLRMPSKGYVSSAWNAAVADGVISRLPPGLRRNLSWHYAQTEALRDMTDRNESDSARIFSLSRPMPLDPSVRFGLMRSLDELRGRVQFMGLVSGQVLNFVVEAGMVPDDSELRDIMERSGTHQFCVRERLPLRSTKEARMPVPFRYSPKDMSGELHR